MDWKKYIKDKTIIDWLNFHATIQYNTLFVVLVVNKEVQSYYGIWYVYL